MTKTPERYNAREVEPKWRAAWDERGIFKLDEDDPRPSYYVLEMFPYPSGRIHMGHVRNYTMGDVVARYKRAKGFNVLHPMGWDAFGLPAENAAMEHKIHPAAWTYDNIATMKAQLKSMGLSLDWDREFATCDVDYYHQQQTLFLDFLKAGLVYRKSAKVNWDPVDMHRARQRAGDRRPRLALRRPGRAARADPVVLQDHRLRRGPAGGARRARPLAGEGPPDAGELDRPLRGPAGALRAGRRRAGRPDRARGLHHPRPTRCSARASSRSRPIIRWPRPPPRTMPSSPRSSPSAAASAPAPRHSRRPRRRASTPASGSAHPFDPSWTLPVYVANFVLMDYGTGAIFGCPAHDQRDLDFARKYGLPVIPVVLPPGADAASLRPCGTEAYRRRRPADQFALPRRPDGRRGQGRGRHAAWKARRVANRPVGQRQVNYRLRDWGISRQRYWGCPIPVIHCERLRRRAGARRRTCRCCCPTTSPSTSRAIRSTATRPGSTSPARRAASRRGARPTPWTPSSIRPGTSRASPRRGRPRPTKRAAADHWLPVDQYIGGIEHAILHLLYSRFFTRAMKRDRPSRPGRAVRRPVHPGHGDARDLQGRRTARWLSPERGARSKATATRAGHVDIDRRAGRRSAPSRRCRSRRRTSSIPTTSSPSYGADTARWFMLSDTPPERDVQWTEAGVEGAARFVQRALAPGRRRSPSWPAPVGTPAPGRRRPALRSTSARSPMARWPRSRTTSSGCASTSRWPRSTSWPTASPRRIGDLDEARGGGARRQGRGARGRRDPGPADRPDDAASGRGMLGGARPHRSRRGGALAGGRAGAAGA